MTLAFLLGLVQVVGCKRGLGSTRARKLGIFMATLVVQKGFDFMEEIMLRIQADICEAYGDPSHPNYGFVTKRNESDVYDGFLAKLKRDYEVAETTDFNDDVSRCFSLRSDSGGLGIRLSLVGQYAAMSDSKGKILESDQARKMPILRGVLQYLDHLDIRVLWYSTLRMEIPFANEEKYTLYEILFSSDEAIFV